MKKAAKKITVIGLTGGIGMGKSAVAEILRELGYPVYEADKAVHGLLRKNGKAVKPVAKLFPEALSRGAIDRKKLGMLVFGHPGKLKKLEEILHSLVREVEADFLDRARGKGLKAAILEIPLLFETGAQKRCDYVMCVTAPLAAQRARVLQRPGMSTARLEAILVRQMPDAQKRKKADFVIQTGGSMANTRRQVQAALRVILKD